VTSGRPPLVIGVYETFGDRIRDFVVRLGHRQKSEVEAIMEVERRTLLTPQHLQNAACCRQIISLDEQAMYLYELSVAIPLVRGTSQLISARNFHFYMKDSMLGVSGKVEETLGVVARGCGHERRGMSINSHSHTIPWP
jgi:hypothetical protein